MDNTKEMSKIAFNQQALTYDKDIKGQHARTLYPYILNMLKGRHFSSILDLVNNPVPVSLLSGDRKPQIRFLGNHHSGSGNLYHKSFRM